jgi:hypothetical protein
MLKFWNAPYPFNDFVVISYKKDSLSPEIIDKVQRLLKDNGIQSVNNISLGRNQVMISSSLLWSRIKDGFLVFSGVARHQGKFVYGQNSISSEDLVRDLNNSVGIFTAATITKKGVLLTQDFTGCGTLFYSNMNGAFVVSNRYHLLLLVLAWMGYKGKMLYSKVIASLYSYTTFLAQNVSSKMDIEGAYQLPFDKEIIIDKQGARILSKSEVSSAYNSKLTPWDKRELLLQGKQEIIENIASVIESNIFQKVVLDLSGGQDSRAVFAALLNVDNAINMVEILTKNVPGSRDLEIAAGLKNLFGGKFYREEGRPQYPISLSESLNIWRSYFMGTYYTMGLTSWSPKGENQKQIRLSGGCGEIYRGFWAPIYQKSIAGSKNLKEMATQLVDGFPILITPSMEKKQVLKELLLEEFMQLPGDTPIAKFDNHYNYFRNRYHFGMRAFEYYHDCPMWFPLISKSLFRLAMSSAINEMEKKHLMLELTEQLHPLLIWIDYDKVATKDNPAINLLPLSDKRFKGINITLDTSSDDWNELEKKNKEALVRNRPKMEREFYEEWSSYMEKLRSDFNITISDLMPIFSDIINDQFTNNINSISQSNARFFNAMYAKLLSIKDQIEIFSEL